jgi:tetratricopeptide (TPR) repeat protein
MGVYYLGVTGNFDKAVETLTELVDKYPADNSGRNNLALASFYTLDFESALEQGREAHELCPRNEVIWSNLALYAMYAGDFETALEEAEALLRANDRYTPALLPVAMAANAAGDWAGAETAYARMEATGGRGPSLANLGLADLALFRADSDHAIELLQDGIALDIESNNPRSAAIKRVMLGKAQVLAEDEERAIRSLKEAASSGGTAIQVPAALALVDLGEFEAAAGIAVDLGESLQKQRRAYAALIEARIALANGDNITAIDKLSAGLDIADLWLLRFHRGQAYLAIEAHVEALDEFRLAQSRIGEATAVFFDDLLTWHMTALLPYYTATAEAALGMQSEAAVTLSRFLEYRESGPEADDARSQQP